MKLVRNDKQIKRYKLIGNLMTFTSLAVLGLGLYFAFQKDMSQILYSYVCLIVGFLLTQIGLNFVNRYGRSPRYDEILGSSFEKLRHEYTYYVYSSPVPMLLLGPCRLWLPIPVNATGDISYQNGKWVHKTKNRIQKMMGQDTVGKPDKEVAEASATLTRYLTEKGIPTEMHPELKPIMVVYLKETQLGDVSQAPYPVVELEDLKRYIRRMDREECTDPISPEVAAKLQEALANGIAEAVTEGAE